MLQIEVKWGQWSEKHQVAELPVTTAKITEISAWNYIKLKEYLVFFWKIQTFPFAETSSDVRIFCPYHTATFRVFILSLTMSHTPYSFFRTGCLFSRIPSRYLPSWQVLPPPPANIPLWILTSVGWANVKQHTSNQSMPAFRDLLLRVMSGGNICLDTHTVTANRPAMGSQHIINVRIQIVYQNNFLLT